MPRKKPVVSQATAAAPAPPATETMDDALREAQDRIVELEHRVEMADADTQRYIDAYERQQQHAEESRQGLREKIDVLEGQIAATPSGATGCIPQPPRQWLVRQADTDAGLEGLLNTLAQEGWQLYTIFSPRANRYHVMAWRKDSACPNHS